MSSSIPAPAPNAPVLRARAVPCAFVPHSGTSAAYPIALSSHALAIEPTSRQAYLFGGELKPRQPVGDEVRAIINLDSANPDDEESTRVYARPRTAEEGQGWPSPRVGATFTAGDGGFIYLWGGRGGKEMAPLEEEESSIWRFSTTEKAWERFDTKGERPEPRSYHTAAYAQGTLYVHAGCPKSGRLSTLHALDVTSFQWKSLPSAPGRERGGTVLTTIPSPFVEDPSKLVLARWGGFSGEELGGPLDIFDPSSNEWTSYPVHLSTAEQEPPKRSVHGFVPFKTAPALSLAGGEQTRVLAVLFFGEGEGAPKELGHDGAGKFLSDVYLLTASAAASASPNFSFVPISLQPASSFTKTPEPRGWFAFDAVSTGPSSLQIVIHGGLNEANERLHDAWSLDIRV
ncbi:hypothetical protein OC846_002444 [Tilletia horrida]|uniref:Galactose oxidase n=1 Tax=Tilletia horrida TaxID=155126 RepID=A0AAN6GU33_9BASI|nr:hypothetical protein OC846_002444 [Tilletia horrida]KAK0567547.1 hypothetical protein OC861_002668 [Tilletia horrida]